MYAPVNKRLPDGRKNERLAFAAEHLNISTKEHSFFFYALYVFYANKVKLKNPPLTS